MIRTSLLPLLALVSISLGPRLAHGKAFQNSYVSFEVPDDWTCMQEGVAWTCTPSSPLHSKEAVIVLAAKVAGPEDNLANFLTYLKRPKTLTTRVGTPMPSQVMYAQQRVLAGHNWIQAQHLGSEIQEYYTLYLATVKDQLAILVSFSSERNRYKTYNPIFDRAMKTLKLVATQKLVVARDKSNSHSDVIGIQPLTESLASEDLMPPPEPGNKSSRRFIILLLAGVTVAAAGIAAVSITRRKNKKSSSKSKKPRTK
ncbi:MAG: hypothetical protein AB7G93_20720 [Bdellovibrionales bacterium]